LAKDYARLVHVLPKGKCNPRKGAEITS
jgi:hypothetical protein